MGKHHHQNHGGSFKSQGHQNHSPESHGGSSKSDAGHVHHASHGHHGHHDHRHHEARHGHRHRYAGARGEGGRVDALGRPWVGAIAIVIAGVCVWGMSDADLDWRAILTVVGGVAALVVSTALLVAYMRWKDRQRQDADAADDWVAPWTAPPAPALAPAAAQAPAPAPASPRPPPDLVTLLVAIPSERRAEAEARLASAPTAYARLAIAIENEIRARADEALACLDVTPPTDGTGSGRELAARALDALVARDAPTHDGGFRDGASVRSTPGPGVAILAIAIVARGVVMPSRIVRDRARLAAALDELLPVEPDAVLHHAYRFVPEDADRAFDDATLRATFPELHPL